MHILPIKDAYVNQSGKLYDSEFLNLVKIKDDHLALDDRTFFLSESKKQQLNQEPIKGYHDAVFISERKGVFGLVADLDIQEYRNRRVKSHELVLPNTIQGMLGNYRGYNTEVAPALLVHREHIDLKSVVTTIAAQEIVHVEDLTLYIYTGEEARKILALYEAMETVYIGDGHHRLYASEASQFRQSVLAYFVDFDSIDILPIHRLLKHIDGETFDRARDFMMAKLDCHQAGMLQKGVVRITYQDEVLYVNLLNIQDDLFWNQDVLRLNTQIFTTAFRQYNQDDLKFVSEIELTQMGRHLASSDVLFELEAVTKEEFIEFADQGYIMAPKSTWFKEKFPSFLVMKKYK